MAASSSRAPITGAVWRTYAGVALLWLIPALIVLPIYLIVVAISAVAADGGLIEAGSGVKGRIDAATGPLLVICGVAAGVVTAMWATTGEGYATGGGFALVTVMVGCALMTRVLRRLAREAQRTSGR
jgi:hypothetical protein